MSGGVTNIGQFAFNSDFALTNIVIGSNVVVIGQAAFNSCTNLTSVIIPKNVISLGDLTFFSCSALQAAYFLGNPPPTIGALIFYGCPVTIYYFPGSSGWTSTFAGFPTVLWNALVQTADSKFGVRTNRFGFNIIGTSNLTIVVEASTNLATPVWSPLSTNTLIGGASYFSDAQWTNHTKRFYRLRSP
jgi:hypothetical protein